MATAKKKVVKKAAKKVAKKKVQQSKPVVLPADLTPEEVAEELDHQKRMDWDINHATISDAFFKLVLKKKKMPTFVEISAETNLSTKTIQRHFEDPQILNANTTKIRALRDKVILTVAIKAMSDKNPNWAKLFLEATEAEFVTKKVDIQSGGHPINKHTLSDEQFYKLINDLNAKTPAN